MNTKESEYKSLLDKSSGLATEALLYLPLVILYDS